MNIQCNKCKSNFEINETNIGAFSDGDIEVKYLSCPNCNSTWQILTTNSEFRNLINQGQTLASKISIAQKKHFRPTTIKNLLKKYEKNRKEQLKLRDELRDVGEDLLKNAVKSDKNEGQSHDTEGTE